MNLVLLTTNWNRTNNAAEGALRPARNQEDYDRLHRLMDAITDEMARQGHDPDTSPLGGVFEVVATFMHAYELEHEPPLEDSTPAETLAFLLEQHDLTQTKLSQELGVNQGLLSKVASGRRAASKELAKKLGQRFNVNPSVFI